MDRLTDGTLRKRLPFVDPALFPGVPKGPDELDEAFHATVDQMSVAEAERVARSLARLGTTGGAAITQNGLSSTTHGGSMIEILKLRGGFSFEMTEDGGSAILMRSRLDRLGSRTTPAKSCNPHVSQWLRNKPGGF